MKPVLSPIMAPDLVCITCGQVMRRVITVQQANGKLDKIMYFCDSPKCQYAVSMTKEHVNCQDDKYDGIVKPIPPVAPQETPINKKKEQTPTENRFDMRVAADEGVPSVVQTSDEV